MRLRKPGWSAAAGLLFLALPVASDAQEARDGWEFAPAPGARVPGPAYRIPFQNDPPYERGETPGYRYRPLDPFERLYGRERGADSRMSAPLVTGLDSPFLAGAFPELDGYRLPEVEHLDLPETGESVAATD